MGLVNRICGGGGKDGNKEGRDGNKKTLVVRSVARKPKPGFFFAFFVVALV